MAMSNIETSNWWKEGIAILVGMESLPKNKRKVPFFVKQPPSNYLGLLND